MATLHLRPYPFHYLLKAIPVFSLALLVRFRMSGCRSWLLFLGLFFSACGDILLDLGWMGGFVLGLAAFLLAHLFYITVFLRRLSFRRRRSLVAVALIAYTVVFARVILPGLDGMAIPLTAYMAVITLMGVAAALGRDNHPLISVGACLFILSDSLIAAGRFLNPIPGGSYWVMGTYYAAQFLIAIGALRSFVGLRFKPPVWFISP